MRIPSPMDSAATDLKSSGKSSGGGGKSLKPTLERARTAASAAALDAIVAAGGPRVAMAALSNPKIGVRTLAGIAARCVPGPGIPFATAEAAFEVILARGALEPALRMQNGVLHTKPLSKGVAGSSDRP